MGQRATPQNSVTFTCRCGEEVTIEAGLLGRIVPCPHCGCYVRAALQFLLAEQQLAPNLTVQCACGHFVVADSSRVGKQVRCSVCKRKLQMPQPVTKSGTAGGIRVPRKVLRNQLRGGARGRRQSAGSREVTRLERAARSGKLNLRPGEHICVNQECGALLGPGANVCPNCGTNRLTGERYEGTGPEEDPRGKWKEV
jgi:ribosomal protein L40E